MRYTIGNIVRFVGSIARNPVEAPTRILSATRSKLSKARQGVIAGTGLGGRLYPAYRGRGVAVMFHEIHQDVEAGLRMGCSPDQLRMVLSALKSDGRDLVSLEEAMVRLADPQAPDFALVTFDDGYRDNRDIALPILEEFDAPIVLFTPTGMITRDIYAWWLGLREIIIRRETITVEAAEKTFSCTDAPSRNAALRELTLWIGTDQTRADALRPTFQSYGINISDLVDQVAFTEAELKAFSQHRLVTIGGHTRTHRFLSGLDAADAYDDIASNRKFLRELTGQSVSAFAYPYGSPGACGEREAEFVAKAGYSAGFTTRPGQMFSKHLQSPALIPREDMGGAHLGPSEMKGRIQGWRRALQVPDSGPIADLV